MFRFFTFLLVLIVFTFPLTGKELTKVRVLPHWLPQAQFAGIYVAKSQGIYEKYGLDAEILTGGPGLPIRTAIATDKTDFFTSFLSTALDAINEGYDIVNIGQLSQKTALMFVAKKSSGIKHVNDLNGKKIGVWLTDFQEIPIAFLNRHNVTAEIVPIKNTINLFLKDGIDVVSAMWYNEYYQIYLSGLDFEELVTFFLSSNQTNIPEDGLYTTQKFYYQNPEIAQNFAKATKEGWEWAFENKEDAIDIVINFQKEAQVGTNRAAQRWMLDRMEDVFLIKEGKRQLGVLREEDFNSTVELLREYKNFKSAIKYEEFYKGGGK